MLKKPLLICLLLSSTLLEAKVKDIFAEEKAENLRYNKAIRAFMKDNEHITQLVYNAYAYVCFPSIGKGSALVGYASGEGRAYTRGGIWRGNVEVTQYSVGLQLGGQTYSEIIFFKTPESFRRFTQGGFEGSHQFSLAPIYSGISGQVDFDEEVEVYISNDYGLMIDMSTGAQSFEYLPKP
jgi:lipid-binding SYLF domain-containing protein